MTLDLTPCFTGSVRAKVCASSEHAANHRHGPLTRSCATGVSPTSVGGMIVSADGSPRISVSPSPSTRDLWFMCCIGRWINKPSTLERPIKTAGAWPGRNFDPKRMTEALDWAAVHGPAFGGAYTIPAVPDKWKPKVREHHPKNQYVAEHALGGVWRARDSFRQWFASGEAT